MEKVSLGKDAFFRCPELEVYAEVYEGQFMLSSYNERNPNAIVNSVIFLDRDGLEKLRQYIEKVQREQTV